MKAPDRGRLSLSKCVQAHRVKFDKKDLSGRDYSGWFLHMVVFPALKDIAEGMDRILSKLDAIEAEQTKHRKEEKP